MNRKIPIVDAIRWSDNIAELKRFFGSDYRALGKVAWSADMGDYIVRDKNGNISICKPDDFKNYALTI
jgi:hypothetical protein